MTTRLISITPTKITIEKDFLLALSQGFASRKISLPRIEMHLKTLSKEGEEHE